jgi:hypothetical protein
MGQRGPVSAGLSRRHATVPDRLRLRAWSRRRRDFLRRRSSGLCSFEFEPRWGFRAAWQKYMEVFPDHFEVRSREQGIWMPFTDVSTVSRLGRFWVSLSRGEQQRAVRRPARDFEFSVYRADDLVDADGAGDCRARRRWRCRSGTNTPRVRPATTSGWRWCRASAAMQDSEGHPALIFRNEPWANGAVWSLNPNPWLPSEPNAATVHWNAAIREQLYGPGAVGQLDGEYLDSLEGYVTANLNFRRDHFAHSTVPLTFTLDTRQPALFKGLAVYEFTRWISEDLHRMGKLCFANGVPYRFSFLCPWLDVMGTETDWLVNGQYQAASHTQMSLVAHLVRAQTVLVADEHGLRPIRHEPRSSATSSAVCFTGCSPRCSATTPRRTLTGETRPGMSATGRCSALHPADPPSGRGRLVARHRRDQRRRVSAGGAVRPYDRGNHLLHAVQ